MYIVAIAWLYVVFMMSITERTAVAGVMTFLLYGMLPLTIVLYLMDTPRRKRNRQLTEKNKMIAGQFECGDAPVAVIDTCESSPSSADPANFPSASGPKT
jgi:Flp pilus assembly protein TadB